MDAEFMNATQENTKRLIANYADSVVCSSAEQVSDPIRRANSFETVQQLRTDKVTLFLYRLKTVADSLSYADELQSELLNESYLS